MPILAWVDVAVADGVVTLRGEVEKKSMIPLAVQMTRAVDGVVHVVDRFTFAIDDTHLPLAPDRLLTATSAAGRQETSAHPGGASRACSRDLRLAADPPPARRMAHPLSRSSASQRRRDPHPAP